jgi:peptidoglycan/LPS O-acetylase OafA/YrhL
MIARYFSGRFLNVEQGTAGDFAGSLAMAFLAAWISWTLFESRVLKLKDRFTA